MAAQPGGGGRGGGAAAGPPVAPAKKAFWSCFSCRVLAGSGLAAAGLWVHLGARRSLQRRGPGSTFDIFRMVFAIGLYAWAIIIVVDPVQPK